MYYYSVKGLRSNSYSYSYGYPLEKGVFRGLFNNFGDTMRLGLFVLYIYFLYIRYVLATMHYDVFCGAAV